MLKYLLLLLRATLRSRREIALENVALRHQLEVLQRNSKRPRLRPSDRALWAVLSRLLPDWRRHLTIVQPDTVVRWHRAGWRLYWRWRSDPGRGRPKVSAEVRALIRRMSLENPLWGAPRIHGELLKFGYDICETTIDRSSKPRHHAGRSASRGARAAVTVGDSLRMDYLVGTPIVARMDDLVRAAVDSKSS